MKQHMCKRKLLEARKQLSKIIREKSSYWSHEAERVTVATNQAGKPHTTRNIGQNSQKNPALVVVNN